MQQVRHSDDFDIGISTYLLVTGSSSKWVKWEVEMPGLGNVDHGL